MELKSRWKSPADASANVLDAFQPGAGKGPNPKSAPYPIVLQHRAQEAVRRHVSRAVVRLTVLIAADIGSLFILKYALRAMRDSGIFGESMQGVARVLLPKNTFYPSEFTSALLLGLMVAGCYGRGDRRRDWRRIFLGVTLGMALISWGRFWSNVTLHGSTSIFAAYSALSFLTAIAVVGGASSSVRILVDRLVRWLRPMSVSSTRVLAVGPAADCRRAMQQVLRRDRGFTTVGYLSVGDTPADDAVGDVADIVWAVSEHRAECVLLCGEMPAGVASEAVRIADSAGCRVLAMRRLPPAAGLDLQMVWIQGEPFVQLSRPSLRGGQLALKRVFDVVLAACSLIILSPLLVLIATAVKVTSRGPIIYRHTRVGRGGRPFAMYKFRSMVRDAESMKPALEGQNIYSDGRLFKMKHDPRVTRLGAYLRRSSLDELPQLWNVLRGDMSMVGPRPPLISEVPLYEEHQYQRFDMKPGVTGPWQVSGRNNIADFDDVVRLESEYMRHWSLSKDLEILARTVPVVLSRAGAF